MSMSRMGKGIASMGKTQGGMRAVTEGIASMAKVSSAVDWWLSGGIDPTTVAGVWQPKGAASLDASYLRLAGDEGYTDIDPSLVGGVAPTFGADGWVFNGSSYMKSGIVPISTTSVLLRFSEASGTSIHAHGGKTDSGSGFVLTVRYLTSAYRYDYGNQGAGVAGELTEGVLAGCGNALYLNGIHAISLAGTYDDATASVFWIGCRNYNNTAIWKFIGKIQAIAIYKSTITPAQVLAVSTAMSLL